MCERAAGRSVLHYQESSQVIIAAGFTSLMAFDLTVEDLLALKVPGSPGTMPLGHAKAIAKQSRLLQAELRDGTVTFQRPPPAAPAVIKLDPRDRAPPPPAFPNVKTGTLIGRVGATSYVRRMAVWAGWSPSLQNS